MVADQKKIGAHSDLPVGMINRDLIIVVPDQTLEYPRYVPYGDSSRSSRRSVESNQ
jgi:hypothetical protein